MRAIRQMLFLGVIAGSFAVADELVIHVPNRLDGYKDSGCLEQKVASMRMYLGYWHQGLVGASRKFAYDLRDCLQFDNLFDVELDALSSAPATKEAITGLFSGGFDAALFIGYDGGDEKAVEWRLYDTRQGAMIAGRRLVIKGDEHEAVLAVAEMVVKGLMGEAPPFLSKIAFVEKKKGGRGAAVLSVIGVDGKGMRKIFESSSPLVSPVWFPDGKKPFVILSQFTRKNVSFVGVDMAGKRYPLHIVSTNASKKKSGEGTYVGLSYGNSVADVAFGRSGKIWRYHPATGAEQLNVGSFRVCASPNLLPDGSIIFCADGKIYLFDVQEKKSRLLVGGGFCVGPSYTHSEQSVVFSKRVNRVMQLFLHNLRTGETRQLTHDSGNKIDPSWSPCGQYVAFAWEQGPRCRIGVLSIRSSQRKNPYWLVTPGNLCCISPSWSPRFEGGLFLP
ncbi:MAG: PD40 domain-containing protein [Candidatus Babeliaceae bacterium]|nr:PD40 domain-containing protein [Candidatus Babeliaceae bacterium]